MKARQIKLEEGIISIPVNATKMGIENLKKVVDYLGKVTKKVQKFKEDGKYSFMEKINTGFIVAGGAISLSGEASNIIAEIKDLSQTEIHDLIMHIAFQFTIDTEKAQSFVDKIVLPVLHILQDGSQIIDGIDDVFGKK
jgi:hypothetical protein